MSTPIEKLEKTIHRREAALRTREAETASREAELEQLKQSLEILECARDDIRGAIEDALSPEPTTTIAPTDVLDIALEGSNNANGPFASGNITVEEAINLALTSIKSDLGPEGLVKMIIKTAVDVSQLGAEAVIKVALQTVRTSDLETSDILRTALQTARGSKYMFASDIITPAVVTAIKLGIEPTVIVKEAFITAMRAEPTRLRTGVLTTLGCAVGMGMSSNGIKGIMDGFAKEVENREMQSASRSDIISATSIMSHIARLREQFRSMVRKLEARQKLTEELKDIKETTYYLEKRKEHLEEKLVSLENPQHEITNLQQRLDALTALESAVEAVMGTKSSTDDAVKHVIEHAMQTNHLTAKDIVQTTLDTAMRLNGRSRSDNLDDLFVELIDDYHGLRAAIESAMERFANIDVVVEYALETAQDLGMNAEDLKKRIFKTVNTVLDGKAATTESALETEVQTRQMLRLRRKYYEIELHFYWQVLNATVMGKKNRSINKFFLEPMTAVATNNPAYDKIVKTPMDFGKIKRNWDQGVYGGHAYGLVSDFDLMIDNSLNYYPRGHRIHNAAKKLRKIYEDGCAEWSSWMSKAITIARGDGRELSKSLVEMEEGY
ncbi:hypothetical protein N8I77_002978 [Diaporthe amygdali]|uniref:Bromo domain-containing protein n=1 Tax=Phomopsis amygdali TaxID=1214568 RepID=A0AAD9SJ95_PHOAM|nr:hypothetical protein N8I77_002978 [Diaporthe amygdali]